MYCVSAIASNGGGFPLVDELVVFEKRNEKDSLASWLEASVRADLHKPFRRGSFGTFAVPRVSALSLTFFTCRPKEACILRLRSGLLTEADCGILFVILCG